MVPSGASTGKFEAVELRDKEEARYLGKGVKKAVENVNLTLAEAILGENALCQKNIDRLLLLADGSKNKENLGANAVLGVSLAVARAAAMALRIPLYQYLGGCHAGKMPVPMMNILNGGRHADNTVDLQEFMVMPLGACCFTEGLRMCAEVYQHLKELLVQKGFSTGVGDEGVDLQEFMVMPLGACCFTEGLRMCAEVYQHLKELLVQKGFSTGVGDEGGFAPDLADTREVLSVLVEAVEKAGYCPGKDFGIAIDAAASELYDEEKGVYRFSGESDMSGHPVVRTTEEMVNYYEELAEEFPIVSLEDGLAEEDWEGWKLLTQRLGARIQLVGDDLFVTNSERLAMGMKQKAANAILIKVNQIGTLTEALDAVELAQKGGYKAVISHRSGETEDSFISDLAVACGAGQIKTGAPCRGERTAKYNQLLRIEEHLQAAAVYENPFSERYEQCDSTRL